MGRARDCALAVELSAPADKRVCLLIGAGGVLGSAFCQRHLADYHIVAVYRSVPPPSPSQYQSYLDPLEPSVELAENGHRVFTIRADLQQHGQIARVTELALARFSRIDLLVNAAGHFVWTPMIGGPKLPASLTEQFEINTLLPLRLAVSIAEQFWTRHSPTENRRFNRNVVNVSSLSGLHAFTGSGQSIYAAAKAALNHLTAHMAAEFKAIGVRVNALAPTAFPRLVETDRVVEGVRRLDQEKATGKILVIDQEPRSSSHAPPTASAAAN